MEFRILRFKPGRIDPPRYETFALSADPAMTVLDALEVIRLTRDTGLMYRHSCHHSSCGTCAMHINGEARLACTTRIGDLEGDTVTLEPLKGFPPVADLVVDMTALYMDIDPRWTCLKPSDTAAAKAAAEKGAAPPSRLEDCIECGCCISACPVLSQGNAFMGPAALAALYCELAKNPENRNTLLALAGSPHG
ncbi:MAG: 2Fe-2S iron-sulfur cluster-binding protein [Desulfosarcinaceae bacterium]